MSEDVIQRTKNRDRNAFNILFEEYRQKVYKTSYLILKDTALAEDAVQETFLQVYLKIHKLYNESAFQTWLFKINVNICINIIRKKSKIDFADLDEYVGSSKYDMDDKCEIPDDILLRKETHRIIMDCIYSLPVKHRIVLTLYYFNDMSIKDISDTLNCSEGTVKSRMYYGKKQLRDLLCKGNFEENKEVIGGSYL